MTKDKAVRNVVRFVAAKHTSHEVIFYYIFARHHYEMRIPQQTRQDLVEFVSKEMGLNLRQADEEVDRIQRRTLNRGLTYQKMPLLLNILIALVTTAFMIAPAVLMRVMSHTGESGILATLYPMTLLAGVIYLLYRFVWNPRVCAMNALWNVDQDVTLGELYATQTDSIGTLLLKQKAALLRFLVSIGAMLLVVTFISGIMSDSISTGRANRSSGEAAGQAGGNSLQARMKGLVVSPDNNGLGYIGFIVPENRYTTDYIPHGKWAVDAADVRAMLQISYGAEAVGESYVFDVNNPNRTVTVYRRFALIELVDMRTGEAVLTKTVYGDEPEKISTGYYNAVMGDGYGPEPTEIAMKDACRELIEAFEKNK